jgi:hypothetical protein
MAILNLRLISTTDDELGVIHLDAGSTVMRHAAMTPCGSPRSSLSMAWPTDFPIELRQTIPSPPRLPPVGLVGPVDCSTACRTTLILTLFVLWCVPFVVNLALR